ncbi:hypothetical protein PY793_10335 [Acetobacter fabarum]
MPHQNQTALLADDSYPATPCVREEYAQNHARLHGLPPPDIRTP